MSLLNPTKGNIHQKRRQGRSAHESFGLSSTQFRVSSAFVDELLDGISARSLEQYQPSSEMKAFVDNLLNSCSLNKHV